MDDMVVQISQSRRKKNLFNWNKRYLGMKRVAENIWCGFSFRMFLAILCYQMFQPSEYMCYV